jgi:hypothetical protein
MNGEVPAGGRHGEAGRPGGEHQEGEPGAGRQGPRDKRLMNRDARQGVCKWRFGLGGRRGPLGPLAVDDGRQSESLQPVAPPPGPASRGEARAHIRRSRTVLARASFLLKKSSALGGRRGLSRPLLLQAGGRFSRLEFLRKGRGGGFQDRLDLSQ